MKVEGSKSLQPPETWMIEAVANTCLARWIVHMLGRGSSKLSRSGAHAGSAFGCGCVLCRPGVSGLMLRGEGKGWG